MGGDLPSSHLTFPRASCSTLPAPPANAQQALQRACAIPTLPQGAIPPAWSCSRQDPASLPDTIVSPALEMHLQHLEKPVLGQCCWSESSSAKWCLWEGAGWGAWPAYSGRPSTGTFESPAQAWQHAGGGLRGAWLDGLCEPSSEIHLCSLVQASCFPLK